MTTLGVISDNVADMLARSDLSSQIQLEVHSAVRFYQSERFWFNEGRVSLSCSSTISEYTLSASVLEIIAVQITRNESTYTIDPISESERLRYDSSNVSGDPSWYSMYRGAFIPYPSPSAVYTTTIAGVIKPATLSATTDSNVWTTNAQELIESRVTANVAMRYLHDDKIMQRFKLLEKEALGELRRREESKQPTRVIPTDF